MKKGNDSAKVCLLKTGHIGNINCKNIVGLNKSFKQFGRNCNSSCFLVPETMPPLYVRSKVCMAPFNMRSKVCIAPIHVRMKVCKFASHMNGSNAEFAPHMEGRHADFAPHTEQRHSFRYKIILKLQFLPISKGNYLKPPI